MSQLSKEDMFVIFGLLSMVHRGHGFDEDQRKEAESLAKKVLAEGEFAKEGEKKTSGVNALVQRAYDYAKRNGFYDNENGQSLVLKLLLIHSEVSEAAEELKAGRDPLELRYRESDGKPEGFGIEVADILIRCFDMAGFLGLDLERLIQSKMDFNETRPYKHGDKF
jgi:NTP pyrophosphatase (non-canonical NTP hydrolase)